MTDDAHISRALAERVLARLGFAAAPAANRAGLAALYAAWCRSVPFDNVRKLIHLRAGESGRLPGDTPEDFFTAWLAHGTGGTCWANAGALCALLEALGFEAKRGISTMLVAPNLPPNHGTVSVKLESETWLVDGAIQHGEPLLLDAARETEIAHPAWGVRVQPEREKWIVHWRSPFTLQPLDCRIDSLAGDAATYRTLHEATRGWSPFNFGLMLRVHRNGGLLTAAGGDRVVINAAGAVARGPLAGEARRRFLVEEAGISEQLAARVPDDRPMPPPPGSRTARAGEERANR